MLRGRAPVLRRYGFPQLAILVRGRSSSHALLGLLAVPLVVTGCAGLQPAARDWVKLQTSASTQYYVVRGRTTRAIFDAIDSNGLSDGKGRRAVGLTAVHWKLGGTLQSGPSSCDTASVTITLDLSVTLPQLDQRDGLSPDLEAKWQRFAARVATHEQRHVDIYLDGAKRMKTRLELALARPSSCAALQTTIQDIWHSQQAETEEDQERFHLDDEARIQTDRTPLQSRIDANTARLTAIESEARAADLDLEGLTRQINATSSQMEGVVTEMRQSAGASFECGHPQPGSHLQTLCQRYESLAAAHRTLVDRYKALVERRRVLGEEHTRLVETTNDLVEAFNWTR